MAKEYQLGRLEKVDPREVWANEARDFTLWLAREDNIALLSEAIGMELEVEDTEKSVGSFSADILCRESKTGHRVCVEIQFEETDDKHLGKIITCAAKLDAVTLIWISSKIREEHQATLNWFNDKTFKDINFLGLEVEFYRVDDSPIAPKIALVLQSKRWVKKTREVLDLDEIRREYWTLFCDLVEQRGGLVEPAEPSNNWIRHSILTHYKLDMGNDSKRETIHINVVITGSDSKEKIKKLEQEKSVIEREINEPLDWRNWTIYLRRYNSDIYDKNSWAEQHDWLYEKLQLFHKVFTKRIQNL